MVYSAQFGTSRSNFLPPGYTYSGFSPSDSLLYLKAQPLTQITGSSKQNELHGNVVWQTTPPAGKCGPWI